MEKYNGMAITINNQLQNGEIYTQQDLLGGTLIISMNKATFDNLKNNLNKSK